MPDALPPETRTPRPDAHSTPAWSAEDLRDNPHERADKAKRVRDMFAAIAGKYDLNNRLHSFGQDQRWRRVAVQAAQLNPEDRVLDVACGTGDLTLAMEAGLFTGDDAMGGWPPAKNQVVGVDFTFEMLPLAQQKLRRVSLPSLREGPGEGARNDCEQQPDKVQVPRAEHPLRPAAPATSPGEGGSAYVNADAMALPFADASFDVVSIAFGLRNVADVDVTMAEFVRVLRPGGRVVVLEFSKPKNRLVRWGNWLYCEKIMPWTATWLARDRSGAYHYLPTSVASFMDADGVAGLMQRHGLTVYGQRKLNLGTVAVVAGRKG